MARQNPFSRLKRYYPKYRRSIRLGFLFLLLTSALYPVQPLLIKHAVDSLAGGWTHPIPFNLIIPGLGLEGSRAGSLTVYALAIIALTLIQGVFRFLMRYIITGSSRRFERDLRSHIFAHLQLLPASYYQTAKTGDTMARMTNDLNAVRMLVGPGFMYLSQTVVTFIVAVSFMVTVSPSLTLYTFVPLILIAVATRFLSSEIHRRSERVQRHFSMVSSRVQENLSGIRVVKTYQREHAEVGRFRELIRKNMAVNMSMVRIQSIFMPLLFSLVISSHLIVLWEGGRRILAGTLTYGDFLAFNVILGILIWPMVSLGWVVNLYQQGKASMERINSILDTPAQAGAGTVTTLKPGTVTTFGATSTGDSPEMVTSGDPPQTEPALRGEIEFRDLTFAYNGRPVLSHVNLKIPAGSTVAVVGPVGCGKSTLANLIPRLYETGEGSLLLDGRPVDRYPLAALRRFIGHVPQDTFLFSDTIRENIAFGCPDATLDRIREAAEISRISSDAEEFPQGYETIVGERGVMLSGGQKQRVAIARAVLLDPGILILDDALSSVDTYTEEQILDRLKHFMKGRTTLITAQRLSTTKDADHIVVLVEGRVAESGTHTELLEADGVYAEMYRLQLIEEEISRA